jgi:hypothetical protein
MMYLRVESSMLSEIGYEDSTSMLGVLFKNGSIYEYANVPSHVHSAFVAAPSHGKYFDANIKGKYVCRKIK